MSVTQAMILSRRAAIDARLVEIDATIAPLELERSRLVDELSDLRVADRIFAKLTGVPAPAPAPRAVTHRRQRPAGIPSTTKMLLAVLGDAMADSGTGLRGSEIVAEIRRRWWPAAQTNDVLPPLLRTMRRGVLFEKDGERYRLMPKADTPPG